MKSLTWGRCRMTRRINRHNVPVTYIQHKMWNRVCRAHLGRHFGGVYARFTGEPRRWECKRSSAQDKRSYDSFRRGAKTAPHVPDSAAARPDL